MKRKRIVITGAGILSPIGKGKTEFWENLSQGKTGFKPITLFNTDNLAVKIAGEISDFNPSELMGRKVSASFDRSAMLLISAVKDALIDGKLTITDENTNQVGIVAGTTFGSLYNVSEFDKESLSEGPRYANPSVFTGSVVNAPASRVAINFKIKGINATISTGICAGLDAIDYACDFINQEKAATVIASAVEDISIQTFLGFYQLKYLSGLSNEGSIPLSCPFDKRRDGIIFAEGASAIIVKDADLAEETGANIYAEILGCGSCFDPNKRFRYNPTGEGMAKAMQLALADAELKPNQIDCIFANANSTIDGDYVETLAIKKVFGKEAYHIPVTAIKSMIGETYSASGGMAVVAALGAIDRGIIPPTINYKENDPRCDLDYVTNQARNKKLSRVMINSFSPNGASTSLIIGRYEK